MKIDNLKPQDVRSLWFEDESGKSIEYDIRNAYETMGKNWKYQFSRSLLVTETICRKDTHSAKWPVRFLTWVIKKMPAKWQTANSRVMSFDTSIGCGWPVIKYLVDVRGFCFTDAAIAYSIMCERCSNLCEYEATGQNLNSTRIKDYLDTCKTSCELCDVFEPGRSERRRIMDCYRAHIRPWNDVSKIFDGTSRLSYAEVCYEKLGGLLGLVKKLFGRARGNKRAAV